MPKTLTLLPYPAARFMILSLALLLASCKQPEPPPPTVYDAPRTEFEALPKITSVSPSVTKATTQATKAEDTATRHYQDVISRAPQVEPGAKATLSDVREVVMALLQAALDSKTNDSTFSWYEGYVKGLREKITTLEGTVGDRNKVIAELSNKLSAAEQKATHERQKAWDDFERDQKAKDQFWRRVWYIAISGVSTAALIFCGVMTWADQKNRGQWILGSCFAAGGLAIGTLGLTKSEWVEWFGVAVFGVLVLAALVTIFIFMHRKTQQNKKLAKAETERADKAEDIAGAVTGAVQAARSLKLIKWEDAKPLFESQAASRQLVDKSEVDNFVRQYTVNVDAAARGEGRIADETDAPAA